MYNAFSYLKRSFSQLMFDIIIFQGTAVRTASMFILFHSLDSISQFSSAVILSRTRADFTIVSAVLGQFNRLCPSAVT